MYYEILVGVVWMAYSLEITRRVGNRKDGPKTKLISVRIPIFAYEQIEALVDLGVFPSRSDFINYAIQKALFELPAFKLPASDEALLEMMALGPDSPPGDDEIQEVLKDVEKEVRTYSRSDRPERRRVLRVRRTGSGAGKSDSPDD
ncbi:type II toxin-antitoxin system ParD family antitoxin [Thermococcus sp. 21S7]|uniref:ribbon-helix-helix domain-containing protein n=1 Tax=Thermococcus sp. 21S7 TaxID=1638221 RepID=UPI00143C51F4|nr:type II toxin-antitoxin system ParD family antitoxin [Thermococcus sp. 21S7]NJE60965.1 hypothetical protein [Thermococcus sp. 21S7]